MNPPSAHASPFSGFVGSEKLRERESCRPLSPPSSLTREVLPSKTLGHGPQGNTDARSLYKASLLSSEIGNHLYSPSSSSSTTFRPKLASLDLLLLSNSIPSPWPHPKESRFSSSFLWNQHRWWTTSRSPSLPTTTSSVGFTTRRSNRPSSQRN